ncbi:MAG: hypothetical protein JW966_02520 [Anaerolineae bacterium]|nr:hypothetical protein [Anaerolineae bacterium]
MMEQVRDRVTGWGARLSLAALLLVFSELVVWQTPTRYSVPEWLGLAAVYLALAAIMLDLITRLRARDVFSLLLMAGIYGLVNAMLISRVITHDLPLSLVIRPLSAQPLVFMLALASFLILGSGRATGPLDMLVSVVTGVSWGVWVRWFPVVSEESIPEVSEGTALSVLALALAGCMLLRFVLPSADIYRREDWLLLPVEWALTGGVLIVALIVGAAQDKIDNLDMGIVAMLVNFMIMMLYVTLITRKDEPVLHAITPPRRPNPVAWLVLVGSFLVAGWIGYTLPGSGDSSAQSDLLFGALTAFGVVWLPIVAAVLGLRAFVQLAREGG